MNHVCFAGELTHEPRLAYRGEEPICELRIRVKDRGAEPVYVLVEARDEQAYGCAEYMRKGRRLAVFGRMVAGGGGEPERVVGWIEFLGGGGWKAKQNGKEEAPIELELARHDAEALRRE